ncbi:MAG: hypothetical protein HGB04_08415 [Chlorobiaceae bacterium]|nr:hypothetical protein [Chlorobiaceae bacterium]
MAKKSVTRLRAAMLLLVLIAVTITQSASAVVNIRSITVKGASKAITAFRFTNPAVTGTVTESNHTIALTVPYGTNVQALKATFTTTGTSVKVGLATQTSDTPNNFTNEVTYTVTAEDGTTQDYVVTVTVARNPAKAITAFSISGQTGTTVINETNHTIAVTMPSGSAVTSLQPNVTITGASVGPTSGTAKDFTNPVTYTVTAEDGTTQDYVVTVTVARNPAKAITAFSISGQTGTTAINETNHTIAVTMPSGSAVTSLQPNVTITGASVSPTSGTAKDFTNPVTYTVTAEDGTTQDYVVTVNDAATAYNYGTFKVIAYNYGPTLPWNAHQPLTQVEYTPGTDSVAYATTATVWPQHVYELTKIGTQLVQTSVSVYKLNDNGTDKWFLYNFVGTQGAEYTIRPGNY